MPLLPDGRVITIMSKEEADALVKLGAGLEDWIIRECPLDTATIKLDEQTAAQSRDPYAEAKDVLDDELGQLLPGWLHTDTEALARKVVDRTIGIYA